MCWEQWAGAGEQLISMEPERASWTRAPRTQIRKGIRIVWAAGNAKTHLSLSPCCSGISVGSRQKTSNVASLSGTHKFFLGSPAPPSPPASVHHKFMPYWARSRNIALIFSAAYRSLFVLITPSQEHSWRCSCSCFDELMTGSAAWCEHGVGNVESARVAKRVFLNLEFI